jgi:hypothetical protein
MAAWSATEMDIVQGIAARLPALAKVACSNM